MDIAGAASALQAYQYAPRMQDAQAIQPVPRVTGGQGEGGQSSGSSSGSSSQQLAAPPRETGRGQLLDISV